MSFNAALGLSTDDVRVLEQVRTRFHPLVYSLTALLDEMAAHPEMPPNWNTVLRQSAMAQANLSSILDYLNEPIKRPDGSLLKTGDGKDAKVVTVSDILATLNPYPVSPFPTTPERLPMLEMLLGKKIKPGDDAYVDARIREAATFCRLPDQWGIEPPQKSQEDDKSKTSGDVKRINTNMDAEEMAEVWSMAGGTVLKRFLLFNKAVKDDDAGYDSEDPDEEVQEIRKQLGMDTESAEESEEQGKQAQPVEQAPLPFETMLKFATTGVFEMTT